MFKAIKNFIFFASILFFLTEKSFSQEYDVVPLLKKIEEGKSSEVRDELHPLLKRNPGDPSLLFVSALLTDDGTLAKDKFQKIADTYPNSKYADAALFRVYSFYSISGDDKEAAACLKRIKNAYPHSGYLASISNSLPEASETPVTESKENYKYTIQVGAFGVLKNAESLKADLEDSGYEVELKEKNVAGTIFNVLYLGKFEEKNSAEKLLEKVNVDFHLNGRIVPLEK